MSNVWATMPYVQLSNKMFVNCLDNKQTQLFSQMSLRDVMELPISQFIKEKTLHARSLVFLTHFFKTGKILFWLGLAKA